jgi:MFS family permease
MGVPEADRLAFVGLFSSLMFLVGMPLVPLWGVWADKYSRKAVIIRSALVEALVFVGVALSHEPWQLAASLLLVGLQLGNTGVMLSAIRDVVPTRVVSAPPSACSARARPWASRSAPSSAGSSWMASG